MLIALIPTVLAINSLIFPLQVSDKMIDIIDGEENATEELTELVVDETVDSVKSALFWEVLGIFGITSAGILAFITKLFK